MPKIHHYHPLTRIFTHSTEAEPDLLDEGRWQVPAFSTMKTPNKERDGLVNQYSESSKAFVLVVPAKPASDSAPAAQVQSWDTWMVPIDDRPAQLRAAAAEVCAAVCGSMGYASAEQLEAEAAKADTSPHGKRATVIHEWRISVMGFAAQLAADVRNGNVAYPPSKRDFILAMPIPPVDPVELAAKYGN